MTNEQFWKKLDNITKQKQTFNTTQVFLEALADGYSQDLDILVLGVKSQKNSDCFNQACIINNGRKSMLYFTDKRHFKSNQTFTPVGSTYQPECMSVYIGDVIDNAIEKDEVTSLIFNQGTRNMYIIPKFMLMMTFSEYFDSDEE